MPEELVSGLFSQAGRHELKAGAVLFHQGDEGSDCYRLDAGVLKVILSSHRGDDRILALLTPGAIVGDLSMIDGSPRSASVIAMTDAKLRSTSQLAFRQCADRNPEIYQYLATLLAGRLRETDETIAVLSFLTVKGRVARALLEIADALGEKTDSHEVVIRQMVSQKELAAMAGVARENVNRVLAEWKRNNLVTKVADELFIRNPSELEREMEVGGDG